MKNPDSNNKFTTLFSLFLCIILIACVEYILFKSHKEQETASSPAPAENVCEQSQEVELETLEDSVHYYEDGL
ncbi:MAG: hypothetical protein IKP11_04690 [Paludibacteraceae bacterium]|nr:hypothetical protein [Paludibacteraceae bacterium]